MANSTVVLITGIARGLGRGLAELYLSRPNHVVIGSVRDKTAASVQELHKLPRGTGSTLLLVSIESTSPSDVPKAVKEIEAAGISHIDIVISNSGVSPTPCPLDDVNPDDVISAFNINAVGPIYLFKGVKHLLEKSKNSPKWVAMSTGAASITNVEIHSAHNVLAYGMTKASQNFFTLAVHSANKWLIAFAVHPGLVQTEMGNVGARMMGMEKAPNTVEESVGKTVAAIDKATREKTSGKFLNTIDGTEFPW
ncbi:NAD(P)-binding protein [Biscogniauxia sp. FL1348]|nr:NAD(P)-binding protein [Biscogniauxia sp. FL1348]